MLTLRGFQRQIWKVFSLADQDGLSLRVAHKEQVFVVHIIKTGKYYKSLDKYSRKRLVKKHGLKDIRVGKCPDCGEIMLQDICLNKTCKSFKI